VEAKRAWVRFDCNKRRGHSSRLIFLDKLYNEHFSKKGRIATMRVDITICANHGRITGQASDV
jgi:hypothetical protein